jgi:hypothetical protein
MNKISGEHPMALPAVKGLILVISASTLGGAGEQLTERFKMNMKQNPLRKPSSAERRDAR